MKNSFYVIGEIGRNEKTQKDMIINCSICNEDEKNELLGDVIEYIKKYIYISQEFQKEDDAKKLLYKIHRQEL